MSGLETKRVELRTPMSDLRQKRWSTLSNQFEARRLEQIQRQQPDRVNLLPIEMPGKQILKHEGVLSA